tara:strand:+ start:575 stop:1042 length:468 start_codon:yes stop_codon:yes gene_type:complete
MKKKLIFGVIVVLLLSSCGFKIVNNKELYNYSIIDVKSSGDSKIGYLLKNNLQVKNEIQNKKIKLDIKIIKNKSIKEKNIKNQITKYEISLNLKVEYNLDFSNESGTFSISKTGSYDVEEKYSQTKNNENNLIAELSNNLVEEIKINLSEITNDL